MKLKYDELLSNVAFTFNLRRYIKVKGASVKGDAKLTGTIPSYGKIWAEDLVWTLQGVDMAGWCRLNPG